uniref:GLOBIN domain-containing protein n=1 Tax=Rhabditophanes sp. KR3021 TaxID=114890 RepID=A0AC35TLQ4_9BILA
MAPEEGIFSSHSTPYIKKHNFSQSLSVDSNYFPELTINTASFETDDGITEIHDFKTSASTRRMQFLNSSGSLNVRSLDSGSGGGSTDVEFEMKPFSRTRSYSPLRYMKTTSQRSLAASDQFLTCEQRTSFNNSWKILKDRILQQYEGSFYLNFGILIFGKVFKKVPELLEVFHLPSIEEIHNLPEDHMVNRHAILFTSLIDLAVRNIDQLESELGPALIIYGQRHAHFKSKKYFSESNIRCLCAQVVCTVAEILLDDLDSNCVNAWIDVLRFMGHTLLCGFDNEK